MQDRFKYRTWIPSGKFFKYWGWVGEGQHINLCAVHDYSLAELLEKYTQQSTGLKDKNGKLIYEGDICRHTKNNKIFSVVWHGTFASFVWSKHKHSTISEYGELFRAFDYYEVIGNIYENPELLEVQNDR